MLEYKKLAEIIIRVKLHTASTEDRIILNCWLSEDEANHQIYKNIIRGKNICERLKLEEKSKETVDLDKVKKNIARVLSAKRRARKRKIAGSIAIAASLVSLVCFLFWGREGEPERSLTSLIAKENPNSKVPLSDAVLILPSGKQIELSQKGEARIELVLKANVDANQHVVHDRTDTTSVPEEWNRIITPRGGNYSFTLSDGSRVWMNAESVLEIPTDFMESERVVKLEGEAYFEVKRDSNRPFIVQTGKMQTKVLGTSFNVRAYGDENKIYTTLVKGKIEVSLKDDYAGRVVLIPGIQSIWKKESKYITSRKADVDEVIAWREGIFKFEKADLTVILKVLSRWYDVEFIYADKDLEKHTFYGRINKDESLSSILETLTTAGGPVFKMIDSRTVEVLEKR